MLNPFPLSCFFKRETIKLAFHTYMFSTSILHSMLSFSLKDSLNTVALPAQKRHREDLSCLRLGISGPYSWLFFLLVRCWIFFSFPLMKLILTGHCSLGANSLLDFPLSVKLAHNHKQSGLRGSISIVKSWRIALLGQKWDDITLIDFLL